MFLQMVEANAKASFLNDVVDSLEASNASDEDVVKDLVSTFLMPEVSRTDLRMRVKSDQAKLLVAAHEELMSALVQGGVAEDAGAKTS